MTLRSLLPALLLGVSSLGHAQSWLPFKEGGQWFGDSTLVLKHNPEGPPDTLRVRTLQVTPDGDTVPNPAINYWRDDFDLEALPAGTKVSNPGTFNIIEPYPKNAPPQTEIIPAPPCIQRKKLDLNS
ncbi:MAG: hypothetical protein QE263_01740 [Vampirovibrionales bacterium]|nr:hypothetical protein [Vampirovibrionales bacterium]